MNNSKVLFIKNQYFGFSLFPDQLLLSVLAFLFNNFIGKLIG